MLKYAAILSAFVILSIVALAVTGRTISPASAAGSWAVDARHSNSQLTADGTTDFGKTKTTFTVGFARVTGTVKLDGSDSANSAFDLTMYPATSMAPPIDEEGKVKIGWFANHANSTLVCFHSKGTRQTADGRLQTTGNLVLTRMDRNVEVTPNEAYAGPVYGPPMIHRVVRQATFVFDPPTAAGGAFQTSGSTKVVREDFPQLLKAVVGTYWPPVVQDLNCQAPAVSEAFSGGQCTGSFLMAPALPQPPISVGEDYPGPSGFNAVVGEHLTILVHMRLTPGGSGATAD